MEVIKTGSLRADPAVELRPEPAEQEQVSLEPRLTQVHELVVQGAHASRATKVIKTGKGESN